MRTFISTVLGVTAIGVAGAWAADMPAKAPALVMPISVYSWTGFYAGVNAGYGWGKSDVNSTLDPASPSTVNRLAIASAETLGLSPKGFVGGVQAGYNYQMNRIVVGLEVDFQAFSLRNSGGSTVAYPVLGGTFTTTSSVKTDWLFTARPRIGYAWDRTLVYVTGGLAVTKVNYSETFTDTFATSAATNASQTRSGWTLGGGLEHALTNNWSVKGEYLYADFGTMNLSSVFSPTLTYNRSVPLKTNIVRAGLNYRF